MIDLLYNVDALWLDICSYCVKYGGSQEFWVQVFIFITGVVGQYLVAKKDIRAFYYWSAGNVLIIISTLPKEQYGMAALYLFAIGFNIYSILQWRKDNAEKPEEKRVASKASLNNGGQVAGFEASNRTSTQSRS